MSRLPSKVLATGGSEDDRLAASAAVGPSRETGAGLGGSVGRPEIRLSVDDPASCLLEADGEGAEEETLVAVGGLGSVSTKLLHAANDHVSIHPRVRDPRARKEAA